MTVESVVSKNKTLVVKQAHQARWLIAGIATFVLVTALAIAYQPVMFNFFTSDDFYIISWLHSLKNDPLLLFHGVYEGTPYYRPLTNVFWFMEYLAFGTDSPLFRMIALGIEVLSATVFGFVLSELSKIDNTTIANKEWPFFAAGLFLLWPIHTEPINWFVSNTEVLVNLFIICTFFFYIRWCNTEKFSAVALSCIFAICAFLTKEAASALPVLLLAYEMVLSKSFAGIKRTIPFWLLLAIYLSTRKFITGSFLGSWGNTVFYFSSPTIMIKAWIQSLKTIVVPLSSVIFENQTLVYSAWISMIVAIAVLSIYSFRKNQNRAALGTFIFLWFFISLAPMFKLLLITPDLLNARYGYIASAPLCAFLMFGLANLSQAKWRYGLFLLLLTFSSFVLRANNLAWAQAGQFTNDLHQEFVRIHQSITGDPPIYFTSIPQSYKGVPINGIKTIQSMNHSPFSNQDYQHGTWFNTSDKIEPNAYVFTWNMQDRHFHPRRLQQNRLK